VVFIANLYMQLVLFQICISMPRGLLHTMSIIPTELMKSYQINATLYFVVFLISSSARHSLIIEHFVCILHVVIKIARALNLLENAEVFPRDLAIAD